MRLASFFVLAVLFTAFMWLCAEVSAFLYVADHFGLAGAVLLTIATSYLGVLLMRRVGLAARQNLFDLLRRSDDGFALLQIGLRDGALSALAAVLLILPGFLSDALGFILAAASSRFWLGSSTAQRDAGDRDVIDLSPHDWQHLDSVRNMPKKP
jgi:UPF0716 protein FxsA